MSLKKIWEYEKEKSFPGMKVEVDGKELTYKEAVEAAKEREKEKE